MSTRPPFWACTTMQLRGLSFLAPSSQLQRCGLQHVLRLAPNSLDMSFAAACIQLAVLCPTDSTDSQHVCVGGESMSVDGRAYPLSSGWQIRFLQLFVVTNVDNRALKTKPTTSLTEGAIGATNSGVVFVIHTSRVTRWRSRLVLSP